MDSLDPALLSEVIAMANRNRWHPSDLLTSFSYETGGKMRTDTQGPRDQYGVPRVGLIQAGTAERKQYGFPDDPADVKGHVAAVERYLLDRGAKPGMGLLDIYSTINAGRPGLYNRSDAANGGAPGTVADKVATQMVGHRANANRWLAGYKPPEAAAPDPSFGPGPVGVEAPPQMQAAGPMLGPLTAPAAQPAAAAPAVPQAATPAANANPLGGMAQLAQIMQQRKAAEPKAPEIQPIVHPEIEYMRRAQMAQAALARQQQGI